MSNAGVAEEKHEQSARRLVGDVREVILIALGILLAFAVDAWWEDRVRQDDIGQALLAVTDEVEANLVLLDEQISIFRVVVDSGESLLARTGPEAIVPDPDQFLDELTGLWGQGPIQLRSSAMAGMITTGLAADIESPALRNQLAAWQLDVDGVMAVNEMIVEDVVGAYEEQLSDHVSRISLERRGGFRSLPELFDDYLARVQPTRFPEDLQGLVRSIRFENAVSRRMALGMIQITLLESAAAEGEKLLTLIDDHGD